MAKSVFYSFHYERDVHRVQLVRNIDALTGQELLSAQRWETIRARGQAAIVEWIKKEMAYKKAVVVLVGQQTATRPWVLYEIKKAWQDRRPLLGVRIHGISSLGSVDRQGADPFEAAGLPKSIPIFDPTVRDMSRRVDSSATYRALAANLDAWSGRGVTR